MPVERRELVFARAGCRVARIVGAGIAVDAGFVRPGLARAAFARVTLCTRVAVVAALSFGEWQVGARSRKLIARIRCADILVIALELAAGKADAVVAMVVDRAGVAVAAGRVRREFVRAPCLFVARIDRARIVVVAGDRRSRARARCLALVFRRAFVRVVAGEWLAVRSIFNRTVDAERLALGVTFVSRAGVVVAALERFANAFAVGRTDIVLGAGVLVVTQRVGGLSRARAGVCRVARAVAFAGSSVVGRRVRWRRRNVCVARAGCHREYRDCRKNDKKARHGTSERAVHAVVIRAKNETAVVFVYA